MSSRWEPVRVFLWAVVIPVLILAAAVPAFLPDNVLAEWETRPQPAPDVSAIAECTTLYLPDVGSPHMRCYICPCETQSVAPGTILHFDASGGRDCDTISEPDSVCTSGAGCASFQNCATSRYNNWTQYRWTSSDAYDFKLIRNRCFGWIKEFQWVKIPWSPLEPRSGWVGVQRDEVDVVNDPPPVHVVAKCNIDVVMPQGIEATVGAYHAAVTQYGIDLEWVQDTFDGVAAILLEDKFDCWHPQGSLEHEVEFFSEDRRDHTCTRIPKISSTQTTLPVFGHVGDGLDIINTAAEFWAVMAWPVDIAIVNDLRHDGSIFFGYNQAIDGAALECGTSTDWLYGTDGPDIVIEANAFYLTWAHEWGHAALCLNHVSDSQNLMHPSSAGAYLSSKQCYEKKDDPEVPPY
ncbi:MAG: hypothetical protein JXR94_05310 [Candidatus Hydrogenedentes bacterium]|nr:hypothetical protein [Candidatus Hydrogenedentota bacterium]